MIQVQVTKNKILTEDLELGVGTVEQQRGNSTFTGEKINAGIFPYDETHTLAEHMALVDLQYNYIIANVVSDPSAVPMLNLIRKNGNDLVDNANVVFTPQVIDSSSSLEASYTKKLWVKIISSTEHHLKRGADIIAKFNPVTHAQIFNFDYAAIAAALGIGTAAYLNHGTSANNAVKLDGAAKLPAVDGSQLTNLPSSTPTLYQAPIGSPIIWLTDTAPTNHLLCNGLAVSRTTYATLFAVIGTAYGVGDGSTTFQLPDFRGYFLRGADNGRGVDSGRSLNSVQSDELKSHNHTYNRDNGVPGGVEAQMGYRGTTTYATSSAGGSETRPKNYAVNYVIRYA